MASKQAESVGSISDTAQLAHTIVMAAEERLSKQTRDQYPHNTVGFMEKAESHMGRRAYKEEGEVKKGSLASRVQAETERVKKSGKDSDIERAVRQELQQCGYDLSSEYI
jgi:hypothetical protein